MSIFKDILATLRNATVVTTPAVEVQTSRSLVAAAAYAAEDVLSDNVTTALPWHWPGMARKKGGKGTITKGIVLGQTTNLVPTITVYLFRSLPTSNLLDNVANTAVLLADRFKYVGRVDFPAMADNGGMSESIATASTAGNLPLEFLCDPGDDGLWGIVVTKLAVTFTAADTLLISWFVRQD